MTRLRFDRDAEGRSVPAARSSARRRAKTDERWFRHRRPSRSSRTSCRPATLAVVSESTREPEAIDVVYLPYLPLRNRAVVGQWELIPRGALADDDCLDQRAAELARGLAAMYVLPTVSSGGTAGV